MALQSSIKITQSTTGLTASYGHAVLTTTLDPITLTNNNGGDEHTYTWELIAVPIGSTIALGVISESASTTFSPDILGSQYIFSLTVTSADTTVPPVISENSLAIKNARGWWVASTGANKDNTIFDAGVPGWATALGGAMNDVVAIGNHVDTLLATATSQTTELAAHADELASHATELATHATEIAGLLAGGGGSGTGELSLLAPTITASTTITTLDKEYYVDSAGGPFTVTIPETASNKQRLRFLDASGHCFENPVTITTYVPPTPPGRTAPDAHDILVYRLNETSDPYVNSAADTRGSSDNLTLYAGPGPTPHAAQFLGDFCPHFVGQHLSSADSPLKPPASSFSVSCWVNLDNYSSGADAEIVMKPYYTRSSQNWLPPFISISISLGATNDGAWRAIISVGGQYYALALNATGALLPTGVWTHVAITYDGTTLTAYKNGVAVGTLTQAGPVDYGWDGGWFIGSNTATGESLQGYVYDVRVADIPRPQSYFAGVYSAAFQATPPAPTPIDDGTSVVLSGARNFVDTEFFADLNLWKVV